jgi:hypothetical protein
MVRKIFFIVLCLQAIAIYCQDIQEGQKLVEMGNQAFGNNEFKIADSLYTAALKHLSHEDYIYINRGLTRVMLQDTCNACSDFKRSAKIINGIILSLEEDIRNFYYQYCIADMDTSYSDKEHNTVKGDADYKYYEIVKKYRCYPYLIGEIHKKGYKLNLVSPVDVKYKGTTDVYALYEIRDTIKYYTYIGCFDAGSIVDQKITPKDEVIKNFLNAKYDFSSIEHKDRWMYIRLYLNPQGNVLDCEILDNNLKKLMENKLMMLQKDIFDYYKELPAMKSPKLFNKKLYFTLDFIIGV